LFLLPIRAQIHSILIGLRNRSIAQEVARYDQRNHISSVKEVEKQILRSLAAFNTYTLARSRGFDYEAVDPRCMFTFGGYNPEQWISWLELQRHILLFGRRLIPLARNPEDEFLYVTGAI